MIKLAYILVFSYAFLLSQESSDYIERAIRFYAIDKLDEAIYSLEDALAFDPHSKQAKLLLVKVLVEKGIRCYFKKDYSSAVKYLNRANAILPGDERVKNMLELITKAKFEEKKPPKITKEKVPPKKVITKKIITVTPRKELIKILNLLESFKESYKKSLEKYSASPKLLKEILNKVDRKRKLTPLSVFGLIFGLFCLTLYGVSRYRSALRERVLMAHKERLMNLLEQQDLTFARSISKILIGHQIFPESSSVRDMISHPNAHVRARGVEMLDEELSIQGDPTIAVKLLLPFLRDPNNRVKANAVKAIYRYDPNLAEQILGEMLRSTNRWMQASGAWVVGEVKQPKAIKMLLDTYESFDVFARTRAMKSFQKIISSPDSLPLDLRKRIEEILEKPKMMVPTPLGYRPNITEILKELPTKIDVDLTVPENQEAIFHLRMGILLLRERKHSEAILEFKECLQYNPNIWQAYEYLGDAYLEKGRTEDGARCYKRALELNPNAAKAKEFFDERKKKK